MPTPVTLTFLGTGNFHAAGGFWNSFLIDRRILMETSPIVLRNLQVAGVPLGQIEAVFISHFHADHTFGWPFLLYSALSRAKRTAPLWVIGPPGIQEFFDNLIRAGRLDHVVASARQRPDAFPVHYLEVTEQPQQAGDITFRAVRVDHDPVLECFGYLLEVGGRTIGYSGDTTLCAGLRTLAAAADVLVLECNARHERSPVHMTLDEVRILRAEFPDLALVLTHREPDVDDGGVPNIRVPKDLETIVV